MADEVNEMGDSLRDLNKTRKKEFLKNEAQEGFLERVNVVLRSEEQKEYSNPDIQFPFIFVVGAPRSGTTLTSQFLAHSFDLGYMDNIAARFWLSPVYGLRLSKIIQGKLMGQSNFESHYAQTSQLSDIHEFGYFWRHWLKKHKLSDVVKAQKAESEIDWTGLRSTLAEMQMEVAKPMVFKNIFGGYHCKKLVETLDKKVLFVQIVRDPLDEAVSILEARKKYNSDISTWWSYAPLEYDRIKDLDYMSQIASQVFYLKRLYNDQKESVGDAHFIQIDYHSLCTDTVSVVRRVQNHLQKHFTYSAEIQSDTPNRFSYKTYPDSAEKAQFKALFDQLNLKNK